MHVDAFYSPQKKTDLEKKIKQGRHCRSHRCRQVVADHCAVPADGAQRRTNIHRRTGSGQDRAAPAGEKHVHHPAGPAPHDGHAQDERRPVNSDGLLTVKSAKLSTTYKIRTFSSGKKITELLFHPRLIWEHWQGVRTAGSTCRYWTAAPACPPARSS